MFHQCWKSRWQLLIVCIVLLSVIIVPSKSGFATGMAQTTRVPSSKGGGKPSTPLSVSLTASSLGRDRIQINIRLDSQRDLDSLQFDFDLPADTTIEASTIAASNRIAARQSNVYHVTLRTTSSTPIRVGVAVTAIVGGMQVSSTAYVLLERRGNSLDVVPDHAVPAPRHGEPLVIESSVQQPTDNDPSDVQQPTDKEPDMCDVMLTSLTLSGVWRYFDHAATNTGVSPTGTQRPIRSASFAIQRQDGTTWTTVATGQTDNTGSFSTTLPQVYVTISDQCSAPQYRSVVYASGKKDQVKVVDPRGASRDPSVYSYASSPRGARSATINFGGMTTPDTEDGSGPMNIFSNMIDTYDALIAIGATPTKGVTVNWYLGYQPLDYNTYYDPPTSSVHLNGNITANGEPIDGDQWDDGVIIHELGHWVQDMFMPLPADSGGPHGDCMEYLGYPDVAANNIIAYSEGWATFFSSAVRNEANYIDTAGGIQGGTSIVAYSLETVSNLDGTGHGNFCEYQVAATLWDVLDTNQDGGDTVQEPFIEIFKASQTLYNGHSPQNINEWWYGWTNTLENRGGNSFGAERAMLDNFTAHNVIVGVRLELTWAVPPRDLDSHLWLPAARPFHIKFANRGFFTEFPYAYLNVDNIEGGPENTWLVSPYQGTYTYAVYDWTDRGDVDKGIAGTQANVKIYDASLPQIQANIPSYTVGTTGTGDWWSLLTINGETGVRTIVNSIQVVSPGPYDPAPNLLGTPKE